MVGCLYRQMIRVASSYMDKAGGQLHLRGRSIVCRLAGRNELVAERGTAKVQAKWVAGGRAGCQREAPCMMMLR
jgi:hypothetical protein